RVGACGGWGGGGWRPHVPGPGWRNPARSSAGPVAVRPGDLALGSCGAPSVGGRLDGRFARMVVAAGACRWRVGRLGRGQRGVSVAGGSLPVVNRTDRLYALVEELRAVAPRPRSARQLAGKYEVSTRTIERDVLALQDAGVPIYAQAGRHGGYVIDKTLRLPPINFPGAEMVAVAVSLARAEGTPFAFATRSALRKVLAAAPAGQLAEAAQLMDRIRLIVNDRPAIGTDRPAGNGPRTVGATGPDAAHGVR